MYLFSYDIMRKCWEDTPEKRPSFSSLKNMFVAMLQANSPYIELHNTATHTTLYSGSHLLDDFKSKKQSLAERLSEEDTSLSLTSSSSSSSVSTPMDASNYQLLKSSPGMYCYYTE